MAIVCPMSPTKVRFLDVHEREVRQVDVETEATHKQNDLIEIEGEWWLVVTVVQDEGGNDILTVLPV
jgi:hypothetical protein